MAEDTQVLPNVNDNSNGVQQPANRLSVSEAAAENLKTGVLLLCKEALITAIQDRRLERGHLRVIAAVAHFMSSRTAKAWPGRVAIASVTGMSLKAVSNTLLELRNFGYLLADKEAVEEANHRRLTVYTFGNIDHETIRREITKFVDSVRAGKVPAHGELESPRPRGTSPPTGNFEVPAHGELPQKVPAHGVKKSPPTGDSNSIKELTREREEEADTTPAPGDFVISAKHGLLIRADTVAKWRGRFKHLSDLEAHMSRLGTVILNKGIMHPGWREPEAWMVGCLAENDQKAAKLNGPVKKFVPTRY